MTTAMPQRTTDQPLSSVRCNTAQAWIMNLLPALVLLHSRYRNLRCPITISVAVGLRVFSTLKIHLSRTARASAVIHSPKCLGQRRDRSTQDSFGRIAALGTNSYRSPQSCPLLLSTNYATQSHSVFWTKTVIRSEIIYL